MLEYARSVLGIAEARHAEYGGDPGSALIAPLACAVPADDPALFGEHAITLLPDSRLAAIYGCTTLQERFQCSYGVNPAFQAAIAAGGLRITGAGAGGEARAVELVDKRFFVATLFLPQHSSTYDRPHPLVTAFLAAANACRGGR